MVARTTPGTHNPKISAETVIHRLREIGERPPYTMHVLYAAFLFWPSIFTFYSIDHLLNYLPPNPVSNPYKMKYFIKFCNGGDGTVREQNP